MKSLPLMLGLALAAPAAQADIYSFRDSNGVIHLTDRPPDGRYKLVMRSKNGRLQFVNARPSVDLGQYARAIRETAQRHALDRHLLDAIVRVESGYDPKAVSRAGAIGLMQLMPGTAERYGVDNPWDARANLDGGARYLRDLIDRFRSVPLALAAYNAGENAVERYGNQIPPYPETRQYVDKVLDAYRENRDRN